MDFERHYFSLGLLDALAYKDTAIHRLDPRTKVIAAVAFIVTVVSFPKYEIAGLVPFFLLPAVVFSLGEIPVGFILKKVLVVSAFAVFIGVFNPLFDTRVTAHLFGLPLSGGWVSFFSILLKFILTMCAALLLVSTTSFPGVCHALRRLGVPAVFVSQLLFLYRYLFVLMEETLRMSRARDLRSFGKRGREMKVFISMVGALFIRTIDRAERIYYAMLARGFSGAIPYAARDRLGKTDVVCLSLTAAFLILCRTCDLVHLIGRHAQRLF